MTASKTAEFVALYRALEDTETRRPALFRDPFSAAFLSPTLAIAMRLSRIRPLRGALERYADWRAPGARTSAIGRTRFIDDVVRADAREGVRQLVVLGAGYDCRAHRLPELAETRVFEVDRPDTQAHKRVVLGGAGAGVRGDVDYIPVDFAVDDLSRKLRAGGWAAERPTTFIWEGVTNYLDESSVADVLRLVGAAASGSVLVFTYIHRGVLDGSARFDGADKLVRNVRWLGEPWTFGLDPDDVGAFVARFGLALEQDLGADEYRERYFGLCPRELRGYGFYRIAVARVPGRTRQRGPRASSAEPHPWAARKRRSSGSSFARGGSQRATRSRRHQPPPGSSQRANR